MLTKYIESMTPARLDFDQRTDNLWIADVADGAYRIERTTWPLHHEFDLTFTERRASSWARRGWIPRYERVSTHRSVERAIARANRHHRDRAKLAEAS